MADLVLSGNTSGAITISAPSVAGTNTITLPTNTGTVITTGSSGQVIPKAALPTGSVLQVVTYTSNSNASGANTTGTTYYASGFIVTITPTSSTSNILLLCSSAIGNNTGASGMSAKFYRSIGGGAYASIGGNALVNQYLNNITYVSYQMNMFGIHYLDSPATTSAVSYQLYFQGNNGGGTGTVYLNGRNNDGLQQNQLNLTALEIAA